MTDVYRNSFVTIAAAAGTDGSSGCGISPLEPTVTIDLDRRIDEDNRKVYIRRRMGQQLKHSPLNTRGWIFQEMVLSHRILHCMRDQIFWQCHDLVESENEMRVSHPPADGKNRVMAMGLSPEYMFAVGRGCGDANLWWRWVSNFSRRSLSRVSDKLPAMAGLAQLFENESGDRSVVGLWQKDLLKHLTWVTDPIAGRSPERQASIPSWSWASLDNTEFEVPYFEDSRNVAYRAEVVGTDIEWSGQPLTSPLNHARIFLRAKVEDRTVDARYQGFQLDLPPSQVPGDKQSKKIGCKIVTLLAWHPVMPQGLSKIPLVVSVNYESLVVESTGRPSEYRRVGFYQHGEESKLSGSLDAQDRDMKEKWERLQADDIGDRIICLV